jgi:hypothetical protein
LHRCNHANEFAAFLKEDLQKYARIANAADIEPQ